MACVVSKLLHVVFSDAASISYNTQLKFILLGREEISGTRRSRRKLTRVSMERGKEKEKKSSWGFQHAGDI
jgi:hypothetical protein